MLWCAAIIPVPRCKVLSLGAPEPAPAGVGYSAPVTDAFLKIKCSCFLWFKYSALQ